MIRAGFVARASLALTALLSAAVLAGPAVWSSLPTLPLASSSVRGRLRKAGPHCPAGAKLARKAAEGRL